MLKKFAIKKLYGTTDVELNIKDGVNIFVGENGIGKTTILNLLHAFITTDIRKMCDVKYDEVIIEFSSHKYKFKSENIIKILSSLTIDDRYYSRKRMVYGKLSDSIIKLVAELSDEDLKKFESSDSLSTYREYFLKKKNNYYIDEFSVYEIEIVRNLIVSQAYKTIQDLIKLKENLNFEILYFPTFRRIETDLKNFDFSDETAEKIAKNTLLRFGMSDVANLLDDKLRSIEKSIKIGFSKMTTSLLDQYVKNEYKTNKINIGNLDTIFSILSDSLPIELKEQIFNMVENKTIYNDSNEILLNYINCLEDIYNEQSEHVNNVEKFVNTCNKYLYNKKLEFIKNELSVKVKSNDDGRIIKFSDLSSGEKQMISIFSKLYLENEKKFFILFDEPELSLSIEWQRMLIPDIMEAGCCKQLLTVTHSPFIFDNKYDMNARSLQDCLKR